MKKVFSIYKNMSITAKASVWFVFCNLMQKGISTITVPIFTRLMTTAEYGTYSIYLSWFSILTIFTSLNLYYGVFNNALNKMEDSREKDKYVSSMQGLIVCLTAIFAVVFLVNQDFWSNLFKLNKLAIWLMILQLMIDPAVQFWLARQRFEFKYKQAVAVTLLKVGLNPVLGLILVILARDDKAMARITSIVISEVLVCGTLMIAQFIKGKQFYSRVNWSYALKFNIPLVPHYLSAVLLNQADRVMIRYFSGASKAGIYSVAYNIGMLVQLFTNSINSSLTPWTYDKLNKKDYESIRKNTTILLLGFSTAIICVLIFVPEVVAIFAAKEYYEAIYVVPPVACSVYFIFLYNIFAIPQMYYERQKFMSVASVLAAILNIILNYIFISAFGYIAAGYTTLVCYIIYSLGHYIFCRKICVEKQGRLELYDQKAVFLISLEVVISSIVFTYLYRFVWIRYAVFAVILAIGYFKRQLFIGLLKSIKNR